MSVVTVSGLGGAGALAYFRVGLSESHDENRAFRYLLGDGMAPMFLGKGAEALGLSGRKVTPELFRSLCAGIGPNGQRLRQNAGKSRDAAWDLTINSPKSLSIAALMGDETTRKRAIEIVVETQREVAEYVEAKVVLTRRGHGGQRVENVEGLVMVAFWHVESRYGADPHLHCHLVVFNCGLRRDGTWGALHSHSLYRSKMSIGALSTADSAARLKAAGVALRKTEHGYELRAVPSALCKALSKGRAEILSRARELGLTSAKALEAINQHLRPAKSKLDLKAASAAWQQQASALGVTPKILTAVFGAMRPRSLDQYRNNARRAVRWAVGRLAEQRSSFSRTDVVRLAAWTCRVGQARLGDLDRAVDHVLEHDYRVVSLGDVHGVGVYTSRSIIETERAALKLATQSRGEQRHVLSETVLDEAAVATQLDEEQTTALRQVAGTAGMVKMVTGAAGTGKTRLLAGVRAAAELQGRRVIGAAPTGVAREVLARGAGIKASYTVAKLLQQLEPPIARQAKHLLRMLGRAAVNKRTFRLSRLRLRRGDVLVVDEAAMVGTRDMARILQLTHRAGAKLVLCGDDGQLGPVLAGGSLFSELSRRLGTAELRKNWRQQAVPWMQDLNHHLAEREAEEALRLLVEQKRLHIARDDESPLQQCVDKYRMLSPQERRNTMVLAAQRAQVALLNERIQKARLEAGEIGGQAIEVRQADSLGDTRVDVAETEGSRFFIGDRVVLRRNDLGVDVHSGISPQASDTRIAGGVVNGDFGEIVAARGSRIRVLLDRGAESKQMIHATIDLERYRDIELGYAATTHRCQGKTVDVALVVADPGSLDAELAYVALTRQSRDLHVFAHEVAAGEGLSEFARSLSRSRKPELATEIRNRISQEEQARSSMRQGYTL